MHVARWLTALAPLASLGAPRAEARPLPELPPQRPFRANVPLGPAAAKKPAIDRDFERYPTLVNQPRLERDLWLVGDVHGDYMRYTSLLRANGLIAPVGKRAVTNPYPPISEACDTTPRFAWSGGNATLVQTGDAIDKGYWNARTLHLHMNLEAQAPESGGQFFMTYGNHEVAFLKQATDAKTLGPGGFAIELWGCRLDPHVVASDAHPMGYWLRRRPVAVRIGPVLAGHGGQTSSRSLDGLRVYWQQGLLRDGFETVTLTGLNSFLRARDFAGRDGQQGVDLTAALDPDRRHPVRHIVHGHNPEIGVPGEITLYGLHHKVPTLVGIDVGMTQLEDYSKGWLLHLFAEDDQLVAEACDHRARCQRLWHSTRD